MQETLDRPLADVDTPAIPEPETTSPSPEDLKAKASLVKKPALAGRKDGTEFCETVYLEEDGGYAYRRVTPANDAPWRFLRTKDFEDAFHAFVLVDMTKIRRAFNDVFHQAVKWRKRFKSAYSSMGTGSRLRYGKLLADEMGDDDV
jgi:hypothetical protein